MTQTAPCSHRVQRVTESHRLVVDAAVLPGGEMRAEDRRDAAGRSLYAIYMVVICARVGISLHTRDAAVVGDGGSLFAGQGRRIGDRRASGDEDEQNYGCSFECDFHGFLGELEWGVF